MNNIAVVRSKSFCKKFIYWYIGNKCNYRCTYCHPNYYNGQHGWHDPNIVVQFLSQLPGSCVIFSGGEPTFHPQLFDIFRTIDPSITVGLVSNGSKPLSYWKELVSIRPKTQVVFSYHYADVNEHEFFNTANELNQDNRCNFMITFLLPTDDHWDRSVRFYQKLKDAGIKVQPKLRFNPSADVAGRSEHGIDIDPNYTLDQVDWVQKETITLSGNIVLYDTKLNVIAEDVDSQYLISRNITDFVGWKCYAGSQNLLISPNGDVVTGLCAQQKKLGNIFSKVDLTVTPYDICRTKNCTGWIDVRATKTVK